MTLEDFFTLTEMKDGLTAIARVQELVAVMKKEKDGVVKNVSDMTRQWVAVASTIVATENKECLDLFVQLDGICFINRWLKDAQTFPNEPSACFVEEAVSTLLQAVEKLPIDDERLLSSGICLTVKGLRSYRTPKVQSKAKALFDSWKINNADVKSMDVENGVASDDAKLVCERPESMCIENDSSQARIPVDQKLNGTESEIIKLSNDQDGFLKASDHTNIKDEHPDSVASLVKLDSIVNDSSMKEVLSFSDVNPESQFPAVPDEGTGDVISEKRVCLDEETRCENEVQNIPNNVDKVEASSSGGCDRAENLPETAVTTFEATARSESGSFEGCEARLEDVDKDDSIKLDKKGLSEGICFVEVETEDQLPSLSRLKEVDKDDEVKKEGKSKKKVRKSSKFVRLTKSSKNTDLIQQTANMDIEDGTFDALEVARLVAKEVEREVVHYDEKSGSSSSYTSSSSSSERISTGGSGQPGSPDSINGEHPQLDSPTNELPKMEIASLEASENHLQDMETSQLTDVVKETGSNKCFLDFDLNEEFSSEELDQNQADAISNPVSVVSASRAMVAPGILAGPLKFEGSLGWKGSAATSAFRPASPRRTSDSDRALSGGAASSGSRQRQVFLDIDLNVAEGGDAKGADHMSVKGKQILPGLPSGESSVELGSRIPERPKFDLNQTDEDGSVPGSHWKMDGLLFGPRKCGRSPSPASSSSCIQPATRNFDLNDNPSIANNSSDMQPFPWDLSSNKDDSVISLLGTKVKKSTYPPQMPLPFQNGLSFQNGLPFQNGRAPEPPMDASLLRGGSLMGMGLGPAVPYPQPVYGYNGFAMGSSVPFPPGQIYSSGGPIPYMFDTRGAPFVPQIVGGVGASSGVPSPYSQSSLFMNMMGPTPVPNVGGPMRPNVNLSSGFGVEVGNRDPSFFRQLFIPGQSRENFRPVSSGSSSGKRKEPESGWELYPTNYKHNQPPYL